MCESPTEPSRHWSTVLVCRRISVADPKIVTSNLVALPHKYAWPIAAALMPAVVIACVFRPGARRRHGRNAQIAFERDLHKHD